MKILFARHADPDYELDSLTEKGDIEASMLADRLCKLDVKAFYCSPQGRARRTASFTLDRLGRDAKVFTWLREFKGRVEKPNVPGELSIMWDWLPEDWTRQSLFFDKDRWLEAPELKETNVMEEYLGVTRGLDGLLADHGYVRSGAVYKAIHPNNDTIVVFCHLGVMAVMVSYLLGVSPMVMLHGFCPAPSSVTTLATEERVEGVSAFRVLSYGDTGHLYAKGEDPAFSGRFCECYANLDERH